MAYLATWRRDDLVVVVQGDEAMTAGEFDGMIDVFKMAFREHTGGIRVVVIADAGPNAAQRNKIAEAGFRDGKSRALVITERQMVRAIVTGLSWFGLKVRAISPHENNEGLRGFLELNARELAEVRAAVRTLRQKLTCDAQSVDRFLAAESR